MAEIDDVHFPEYRAESGLAGARALGLSSFGGIGIMAGRAGPGGVPAGVRPPGPSRRTWRRVA
ncbi:hypothetical protein ACFWOX_30470 [Streptomyces sp. NPDC058467]|uniref:hypothetical protein n=1 Tax=unclassified Streptomyces TaxID=2593676 RepID=UPI003667A563